MTSQAPVEKKAFTGSCTCGKIKYLLHLPIPTPTSPLTANRCNCTFCQKPGRIGYAVSNPTTAFQLLSPVTEDEMSNYKTIPTLSKYFCGTCGVHVYQSGTYEAYGQTVPLFSVNLATLDQPQEGLELSELKLKYLDMRNDNFQGGFREEPWAGGVP